MHLLAGGAVTTNHSSLIFKSHDLLIPAQTVNMCVKTKPFVQRSQLTHSLFAIQPVLTSCTAIPEEVCHMPHRDN